MVAAAARVQLRRASELAHRDDQGVVQEAAVREVAHVTQHLLDDLVTTAPPKNREVEAEKARARAALRYGT